MEILLAIYHSPVFRAAITGGLIAARVDYLAFQGFKSLNEAEQYNWSIAAWRWFQGAVGGVVTLKMIFPS